VHLQDRGGALGERGPVVRDPRAVRGADLDELGAGGGHDVGDPELAADLDELAAGDEHLLALGDRGEGEQHAGRPVVHDEGVLGAGEGAQEELGPGRPAAAATGGALDLEVGVAGRGPRRGLRRLRGERSPTEAGVEDHAGGVDDRPDAARRGGGEAEGSGEDLVAPGRLRAPGRLGPELVQDLGDGELDHRSSERLARPTAGLAPEQRIDRWEPAPRLGGAHASQRSAPEATGIGSGSRDLVGSASRGAVTG